MEAKELRIGNYINDIKHGYMEIYMIGECNALARKYGSIDHSLESPDNGYYPIKDILPIPLTEEILLKCGFADTMLARPSYVNGLMRLEPSIKMLKTQSSSMYAEYDKYWVVRFRHGDTESIKITELNSLHQLQNLYFALTGTELEINL